MIQLTPQLRILVAIEPVDFRKGIDGLSRVVKDSLAGDPFSGAVFVFRNRRGHMLRLLSYDGGAYWLCTRRLSKGTFSHWPTSDGTAPCSPLLARDLQVLIWGGDPSSCSFPDLWRQVA